MILIAFFNYKYNLTTEKYIINQIDFNPNIIFASVLEEISKLVHVGLKLMETSTKIIKLLYGASTKKIHYGSTGKAIANTSITRRLNRPSKRY